MLFRQLFDPSSSTYTYLLVCQETNQCALIDPVFETLERDLSVLQALGLQLNFTIETHVHADHLTSARRLKKVCGSKIVYPQMDNLPCADIGIEEGQAFRIGQLQLHPLFTPGHTAHHHAYLIDNGVHKMLFSGDALLIDACGRTDFQSGDASKLYDSIHRKFYTLPNDTLVYPCHDYEGRFVSTIGQEKKRNPFVNHKVSEEDFVQKMQDLKLPYPKRMDFAVPGNEMCGLCPKNAPDELRRRCDQELKEYLDSNTNKNNKK